jgi:hypothetical protein
MYSYLSLVFYISAGVVDITECYLFYFSAGVVDITECYLFYISAGVVDITERYLFYFSAGVVDITERYLFYISAGVVDITEPEEEEEDQLDEATRQFNFWTHQIHIFFVKKFFPAAEKYTMLKQMAETKRINDAREKMQAEQMEDEA